MYTYPAIVKRRKYCGSLGAMATRGGQPLGTLATAYSPPSSTILSAAYTGADGTTAQGYVPEIGPTLDIPGITGAVEWRIQSNRLEKNNGGSTARYALYDLAVTAWTQTGTVKTAATQTAFVLKYIGPGTSWNDLFLCFNVGGNGIVRHYRATTGGYGLIATSSSGALWVDATDYAYTLVRAGDTFTITINGITWAQDTGSTIASATTKIGFYADVNGQQFETTLVVP